MQTLAIQLLGGFQLLYGDAPIIVSSERLQSLLAYLLLNRENPQARDQIAYQFWPESTDSQARANLRKLLHQLRKTVPDVSRYLSIEPAAVQWRTESPYTLDVAQFEEALIRAESARKAGHSAEQRTALERAVELYSGDLLPTCYDDWLRLSREQLRQAYWDALHELVQLLKAQGEYRGAIHYARQLCHLDPLREATYRQLMRLYSLIDERASAIDAFRQCERLLREELDVEPSAATRDLHARILAADSRLRPRHNLPSQLTSFVGRGEELTSISKRIRGEECRLLTLVGPGGVGKTRLMLQAAFELIDEFEDGVFFISLASVSTPELLLLAMAEALAFTFYSPHDRKQQLIDYLREKQMLLVLDDFEHLPDATGLLVDILGQAPHVKSLVTSRQHLQLQSEWLLPLDGLRFPKANLDVPVETYSAVRLFQQRAQLARPGFVLTEKNKSAVVRICQLVEGLPLAVELAAAWVRILACSEIANELERNLDFLAISFQDVPERHRSLRAVFDHSWNRLSAAEKSVFRKLSVFQGSFDRQAAERVAGAFLPFLLALADKSLLRRTADGRYVLHELLRWYGGEKLAGAPQERALLHQQHGRYYTDFLQQREEQLKGSGQKTTLDEINLEIDNIEAAWRWAVTGEQWRDVDEALGSLYIFYSTRGWYERGEEAIKLAIDALTNASTTAKRPGDTRKKEAILFRLLARQGALSRRVGRLEQAQQQLEKCLERFQVFEDAPEIAFCLSELARIATERGDFDRAMTVGEEALLLYRRLEDQPGQARICNTLGRIACSRSSFAQAERFVEQALALGQTVRLRPEEAEGLRLLGVIAARQSDYAAAVAYFRRALTIYRELGHQRGISRLLGNLGTVLLEQGDYAGANENYAESLRNLRHIGDRAGESIVLNNMGLVYLEQGNYGQAETYFGQALQIKKRIGNLRGEVNVLINLGIAAFRVGRYETARQLYQRALTISRKIDDRRGQSLALSNLSLLLHYMDENAAAQEVAEQALALAQELGDRIIPDYALTRLGHALAGLGHEDEAAVAYQQALALRRELKQAPLVMVTLAGLARLAQATGDLDRAREYVAEILELLRTTPPAATLSTFEPFQVYLTCYRLLAADQGDRASSVLQAAYRLLHERAARIADGELRDSFLENVPEHREIVSAYQRLISE